MISTFQRNRHFQESVSKQNFYACARAKKSNVAVTFHLHSIQCKINLIRSSHPVVFCNKGNTCAKVLFLMKLQTLSKKRFWNRCFLVNFVKFLIAPFLKNPLDSCFCINTCSVYCPTMTFFLFKNNATHIFRLSILLA